MNSQTESDLEFFMLLKGNSLQKYTVMTISFAMTLSFMFQFQIVPFAFTVFGGGGPFDLILIVGKVV